MSTPLVSVVLPVLNGQRYLKRAIDSVLVQTVSDLELLVVDDGSTDDTPRLLAKVADRRLRVVTHDRPLGIAQSLDDGIDAARAPLIARLDADDYAVPERLERQLGFLSEHPDVAVVGSAVRLVDGDDRPLGDPHFYPAEHWAIHWKLYFECPLAHPSVVVRRDRVLAAGGYVGALLRGREAYSAEDYDLWRRMAAQERLANLPEVLVTLRKHGGNITEVKQREHLVNSAMVAREAIRATLDDDVPLEVVQRLFRAPTPGREARETTRLIARLASRHIERYGLSGARRDALLRDAAERVAPIALLRPRRLFGLARAFRPAVQLSPRATARAALERYLRRLYAR